MTLFPKKSHSEVLSFRTSRYLFRGHNSTHNTEHKILINSFFNHFITLKIKSIFVLPFLLLKKLTLVLVTYFQFVYIFLLWPLLIFFLHCYSSVFQWFIQVQISPCFYNSWLNWLPEPKNDYCINSRKFSPDIILNNASLQLSS